MKWIRNRLNDTYGLDAILNSFDLKKMFFGFDLQATGPNINKDKFFSFSIGFIDTKTQTGHIHTVFINPKKELPFDKQRIIAKILSILQQAKIAFTHNLKFKLHILENTLTIRLNNDNLLCTKLLARYFYSHLDFEKINLKNLTQDLLKKDISIFEKVKREIDLLEMDYKKRIQLFWDSKNTTLKEASAKIREEFSDYVDSLHKPALNLVPKVFLLELIFYEMERLIEIFYVLMPQGKHIPYFYKSIIKESGVVKELVKMEKKGFTINPEYLLVGEGLLRENYRKSQDIKFKDLYKKYLFKVKCNLIENQFQFVYDYLSIKTGRIMSNLQLFPKKGVENVFEPRKLFIAPEDYFLVSFDYNQIEFRLQAEFINRQNPNALMPTLFKQNLQFDIHSQMAQYLGGPQFRQAAKIINHSILYGSGLKNLQDQGAKLGLTPEKITHYFQKFKNDFLGFYNWKKTTKELFKQQAYVLNLFNMPVFGKGEYQNFNHLVQSSCAMLLKSMLSFIGPKIEKKKSYMQFIIHDEIQFCIHKEELSIIEKIKKIMERKNTLAIPLKVNVNWGKNWGELKPWKEVSVMSADDE